MQKGIVTQYLQDRESGLGTLWWYRRAGWATLAFLQAQPLTPGADMPILMPILRAALMAAILAPTLLLSDCAFAAGHSDHQRAGATTGAR
jgi:hypothetical protein